MTNTVTVAQATHANRVSYSDIEPHEITRIVNEKQLVVRQMDAERDPTWKPETVPGGFAGHTVNNNEQRWIYTVNKSYPEKKIRLHKDGIWRDGWGMKYSLATAPRKFYDYNF